jgi:hypothetical protein
MPSRRTCRLLLAISLTAHPLASADDIRFAEGTRASGLSRETFSGGDEKPHILESTGNGVLALDYDGDGFQDLFFVAGFRLPRREDADERSALYRNRGDGTFVDVSGRAGIEARVYGQGGCVGDVDGDGRPDVYLTAFGPNLLYHNNGDGTFSELGAAAGVDDPHWSVGCTFFDADGDGDHDLFVGNYLEADWDEVAAARRTRMWRGKVAVMDGPRGLPESANTYYRNDGTGRFDIATASAGLDAEGRGYTMGVASFDYDRDGDVDLYLANDSTPNRLYRNDGGGAFEEVGTWSGAAYDAEGRTQGSMGVGVGDVDGDGWLDLAVTNFAHDHYTLYRNLGGGLFADVSHGADLAVQTFAPLGWAAVFLDADNDGDLDLFFANGHIYPQVDDDPTLGESFRQANQLFANEGGRFRDVSAEAGEGLALKESSRGAVAVDADNDGDLDLAVSNQDARPQFLVNLAPAEAGWLILDLERSGRALGARAEVAPEVGAAGRRQVRERASGGGYASEGDPRLHFGLGRAPGASSVAVLWPGGRRADYRDLPADRIVVLAPLRVGSRTGGGGP